MPEQSPRPMPPEEQAARDRRLRIAATGVMICSILGLFGFGICSLFLLAEPQAIAGVLFVLPPLLFFGASVWVCRELLRRLS
ncbi:MAG: hypothetical protein R3E84_01720 [Pseudomonadales bacterium]